MEKENGDGFLLEGNTYIPSSGLLAGLHGSTAAHPIMAEQYYSRVACAMLHSATIMSFSKLHSPSEIFEHHQHIKLNP